VPSLRHVVATAAAVNTLRQLAPGRVVLAVGTGYTGRRLLGQQAMPWTAVKEYVVKLRALLEGGTPAIDGHRTRLMWPERHLPTDGPPPILLAANGPRGLDIAREVADGIMSIGAPQPGFGWCALMASGTVLGPGEQLSSSRVLESAGPAAAFVAYHATYELDPASVAATPGGAVWHDAISATPAALRHLYVHEGHMVELTERDRLALAVDHSPIPLFTWTGSPESIQDRIRGAADAGATEIMWAAAGPDVPAELERFATAVQAASRQRDQL
jgi:5,10-methylenetetrahydromethanopterin reductase